MSITSKNLIRLYIYILLSTDGFNVIDSMRSYSGKYYFCEHCSNIFSYVGDHEFFQFKEYDKNK